MCTLFKFVTAYTENLNKHFFLLFHSTNGTRLLFRKKKITYKLLILSILFFFSYSFVFLTLLLQCEDFLTSSDVGEHSRFFVKTFFENAKNGVEMKQNKMIHQFTKKEFLSYIPSLSNDVHERAS